jgi:hypothetical protein
VSRPPTALRPLCPITIEVCGSPAGRRPTRVGVVVW